MPRAATPKAPAPLRCDFCHRTEDDVAGFARGRRGTNICGSCIALTHELLTTAWEKRIGEADE